MLCSGEGRLSRPQPPFQLRTVIGKPGLRHRLNDKADVRRTPALCPFIWLVGRSEPPLEP